MDVVLVWDARTDGMVACWCVDKTLTDEPHVGHVTRAIDCFAVRPVCFTRVLHGPANELAANWVKD